MQKFVKLQKLNVLVDKGLPTLWFKEFNAKIRSNHWIISKFTKENSFHKPFKKEQSIEERVPSVQGDLSFSTSKT